MLKVSAFYLEKQKSFTQKKYDLGCSLYIGQESSNIWRFAVPIFREGFGRSSFLSLNFLFVVAIVKGSRKQFIMGLR